MKYTYIPTGICPTEIVIDIEGDILKDVEFEGGCNGNLQALSILIKGMPISEVKEKLSGIQCGENPTSCADQLVKGIDEALGNA
jgi:uncharacterized protein (TIGR03905 family)